MLSNEGYHLRSIIRQLTTPSSAGLGAIPPALSLAGVPTITGSTTAIMTSVTPTMASTQVSPLPQPSWNTSQTLSLPPKLVKKILDLEFVDMSELLPDSWRSQEEEQKCCHQRRVQRRGPVTDILLWVECFSSMVTILSSRFEGKTPHFMAYQQTIVKAHRAFTGEGWITYDTCYRRKAAVLKSLDWGVVDFTLYNETFTGRAKSIPRCRHCLSEHHPSHECTYVPDSRVDMLPRTSTRAARMLAPICQLYNGKNGSRCNFNPCKFQHLCADCWGNHPAAYCRKYKSPLTKRPRSRSPPYNSKK